MTTKTFPIGPTTVARAAFIAWLADRIKSPVFAERHADALIEATDWGSSPKPCVEVRGMFTISGNPETYTFDANDLIFEASDD